MWALNDELDTFNPETTPRSCIISVVKPHGGIIDWFTGFFVNQLRRAALSQCPNLPVITLSVELSNTKPLLTLLTVPLHNKALLTCTVSVACTFIVERDSSLCAFATINFVHTNYLQSLLPAVISCSTKLAFFTNLSLSDLTIFSYSSFTPTNAVVGFAFSSFHCSASCSAPITFSSLSSNLCLSSSILADCFSPSYTSTWNFWLSTCNCCISCHAFSSCIWPLSCSSSLSYPCFLSFPSPGQAPKCSSLYLDHLYWYLVVRHAKPFLSLFELISQYNYSN